MTENTLTARQALDLAKSHYDNGAGQMTRIILSILRQAAESLTTRDIALQLLVERALHKNDQRLLRLMTKRVGVALRGQRERGAVRSEQGPGQYQLWEIAR